MIDNNKIYVAIDEQPFNKKPTGSEIGTISNRLVDQYAYYSPQEIAEQVGNRGKTFLPAILNGERKNNSWLGQRVICVDFDNKVNGEKTRGESYSSLADILEMDFTQKFASFAYKTFSHTDDWERFRLVFILDKTIEDQEATKRLNKLLLDTYPNIDRSTGDLARIFFGGTEAIEVDYSNVLPTSLADNVRSEYEALDNRVNNFTLQPKFVTDEEISDYIQIEADNLRVEENWVSIRYALKNSFLTSELDANRIIDICRKVAMGNKEWEANNVNQMMSELRNSKQPDSTYTFGAKVKIALRKHSNESKIDQFDFDLPKFKDESDFNRYLRSLKNKYEEDKKKLTAVDIANILKGNIPFVRFNNHENSRVAMYQPLEGIYTENESVIRKVIKILEPSSTKDVANEVIYDLTFTAPYVEKNISRTLAPMNNGIYNRETKTLEDFSPSYVFTTKLPIDYVEQTEEPDCDGWKVSEWLQEISCGQEDFIEAIWQTISASITGNYGLNKSVWFVGDGANGKGTMIQLIMNLIGKDNVAILRLGQFAERFNLPMLEEKMVCIGDDVNPRDYQKDASNFKSIVTGDPVMVERKGVQSYSAQFNMLVIQTTNEMPRFKDKSKGITRRLLILNFEASFEGQEENKDIKLKYINDKNILEWVAWKAVNMSFNEFTIPASSEKALKEFRLDNEPILQFKEEVFDEYMATLGSENSRHSAFYLEHRKNNKRLVDPEERSIPTKCAYLMYLTFCTRNNYNKPTHRNFTNDLLKILGNDWISKQKRVSEIHQDRLVPTYISHETVYVSEFPETNSNQNHFVWCGKDDLL